MMMTLSIDTIDGSVTGASATYSLGSHLGCCDNTC